MAARTSNEAFATALNKKYARILEQETEVLRKRDEVDALRVKQAKVRNAERTTAKLNAWRGVYSIAKTWDQGFRPPDQKLEAKTYSIADKDQWDRGELRSWYQAYARPPDDAEPAPGLATGYLVTRAETGPARVQGPAPTMPTNRGPPPMRSRGQEPHWMLHEDQLGFQKQMSEDRLEARMNYPPLEEGRVDGYRQAPWKDRPQG